MIIIAANTKLHIERILVTCSISRRPRRSVKLVDAVVGAALHMAADAKITTRSGTTITTIIRMVIEMIMEMVFKGGAKLGYDIAVIKSVDGILPILLYLMLFRSVILALLP